MNCLSLIRSQVGLVLFQMIICIYYSTTSVKSDGVMMHIVTGKATGEQMATGLKILMANIKLRKVSAASKHYEMVIYGLMREKECLKEEISELEKSLNRVSGGRSDALRVLDNGDVDTKRLRAIIKISPQTEKKLEEWEKAYRDAKTALSEVRQKINHARSVINDPVNYISVPTNYGNDPVEQRDREKRIIIKDRENMDYRLRIIQGEVVPLWIEDIW